MSDVKNTRLLEKARLFDRSYLTEKMKRNYLRIAGERISRFTRTSE